MDRHPFPPGDITDNFIAGYGITALGESNQQAFDSFYDDSPGAPGSSFFRRQPDRFPMDFFSQNLTGHHTRGHLAVSHRRQQIIRFRKTKALSRVFQYFGL